MRAIAVAAALLAGCSMAARVLAGQEVFGSWRYDEAPDAITDAPVVNAGIARTDGAVIFRCEEKLFIAYVQLEAVDFFFEDSRQVTYRIDKDPPKTVTFQRGRRGGSLVAGDMAVKMAREVAQAASTIALRSAGKTAVFPVDGAKEAIGKLLDRCPNKAAKLGSAE